MTDGASGRPMDRRTDRDARVSTKKKEKKMNSQTSPLVGNHSFPVVSWAFCLIIADFRTCRLKRKYFFYPSLTSDGQCTILEKKSIGMFTYISQVRNNQSSKKLVRYLNPFKFARDLCKPNPSSSLRLKITLIKKLPFCFLPFLISFKC